MNAEETLHFFHGKIPRGSPQKESIAEGEENDETALRKFAAAAVLAVSFTGLSMVSASAAEPAPAPAVKVTAGHDQLGSFAPEFAHLNDDVLFGEVWSRTDKLPAKIRSIVTVTSLFRAAFSTARSSSTS